MNEKKNMWILIKFYDCYNLDDTPTKEINKIVKLLEKTGLRYGFELNRSDLIDFTKEG